MYNNPLMSDIKFSYKFCNPGQELYAHKYVLATSSPVFQEMFYGGSPTKDSVIELPEIDKDILEAFLAYLYKDECPNDDNVMFEVHDLTLEYKIPSFHEACKNDSEQKAKETATAAFECIEMFFKLIEYVMTELRWLYRDEYTEDFFASEHFLKINATTLNSLLTRDTLSCNEKTIYKAVVNWANHQCLSRKLKVNQENRRQVLGDAIYEIRFHTMEKSTFSDPKELSALKQLLSNSEVIDLRNAINGEKVRNLKWDLSKQKRVKGDLELLFWRGVFIGVSVVCISIFGLFGAKIGSFCLLILILIFLLIVYFYPQFASKLIIFILYG